MRRHKLALTASAALLTLTVGCGRSHSDPPPMPPDADADAAVDASADATEDAMPDIGPPDVAPSECEVLGPAACLTAGCVPTYDDACCPVCTPEGFCADCSNPDFFVCRPFEDACMAAFCSMPATWSCDGSPPDCDMATPFDEDSCDRAGCVPAIGPVGSPELPAICVPITAASCMAFCRIEPPECPGGTVPEGDGDCYTGLCIPGVVCG